MGNCYEKCMHEERVSKETWCEQGMLRIDCCCCVQIVGDCVKVWYLRDLEIQRNRK
jgi:hypothetical protein